uniref:Uncharacterized protein n=1 Tax=Anguilla anguilla TaxID=7936 RepID=A0A0E9U5H2_ANGAN
MQTMSDVSVFAWNGFIIKYQEGIHGDYHCIVVGILELTIYRI